MRGILSFVGTTKEFGVYLKTIKDLLSEGEIPDDLGRRLIDERP